MRTFDCPNCKWSGHPSFDLNGKGKLVAVCQGRDCGFIDQNLTPSDFAQGAVATDGKVEVFNIDRPEVEASLNAAPKQARPVASRAPVAASAEPTDVIGLIKARRDWLEMEVARADGYRIELRKLTRMLKAAQQVEAHARAVSTAPLFALAHHTGDAE